MRSVVLVEGNLRGQGRPSGPAPGVGEAVTLPSYCGPVAGGKPARRGALPMPNARRPFPPPSGR